MGVEINKEIRENLSLERTIRKGKMKWLMRGKCLVLM